MISILIAEDKDLIRQGLVKMIRDTGLPIQEIFEASDGLEAIGLLLKHRPELVLTDILMPRLDGLQLIERAREEGLSHIRFVIISGYGEFDYAQRALRLNVDNYLLKPIHAQVLSSTISQIINELDEQQKKTYELQQLQVSSSAVNRFARYLVKDAVEGALPQQEVLPFLDSIGLTSMMSGYFILAVYIGQTISQNTRAQISQKIEESWQQCRTYTDIYDRLIGLVAVPYNEYHQADRILSSISTLDDCVYCAKSDFALDISQLSSIWRQSLDILDYRLLLPDQHLLSASHMAVSINKSDALLDLDERAIANAVCMQNQNQLSVSLNRYFHHFRNNKMTQPRGIKNSLLRLHDKIDCPKDAAYNDTQIDLESLYQSSDTLSGLQQKVEAMLHQIFFIHNHENTTSVNQIVQLALKHIQQNYQKDISLASVANHLSVNYNYLSTLFKQEISISFSRYLNLYRIERAKELLSDPLRRINEVAGMVGFNDEKYFCRVFKELCGLTPYDFKSRQTKNAIYHEESN